MRAFGRKKWHNLHAGFKKSGKPSLERYGLTYLHSDYALRALARATAASLRRTGISTGISIQSVWVDGTPQVTGFSSNGARLKSELADLLFILNETDLAGLSLRRTGLLLQAKTSKRMNRLPSNPSTKSERQLLENLDRSRSLDVYRDTKASPSSLIGKYTLGGPSPGLKDCSRYLIMAKETTRCPYCDTIAPFQIGWPPSLKTSELRHMRGIVEAIQRAVTGRTNGRQVLNNGPTLSCQWSKLVWDLMGDYGPITMNGYDKQPRVNSSGIVLSFTSGTEIWSSALPSTPPQLPTVEDGAGFGSNPPSISILQINLRTASGARFG